MVKSRTVEYEIWVKIKSGEAKDGTPKYSEKRIVKESVVTDEELTQGSLVFKHHDALKKAKVSDPSTQVEVRIRPFLNA